MLMATFCLTLLLAASARGQVIRSGPPTCHGVALTFDMCPVRDGPGFDSGLVRLLIDRRIPATFFLSGRWIARHDAQLRDLLTVPYFEFGTHGQAHAHLPLLDATQQQREIQQAVALLQGQYHLAARLFRPPYGEFDETTVEIVRALGLQFILWNVVSGDPDPTLSAEHILRTVGPRLHNGTIVVFHANGKGQHTEDVVKRLTEVLASRGLRPMTVSELLGNCGNGAKQPD
jgi:peptidoglycan/xylan/chitin deacetylase (PgdA/CDA1 family)